VTVFVSYASSDVERVTALQRDLGALVGGGVWIDSELHGGQQWWSAILDQIRTCDLFVFALSPRSLRSEACMAELGYAVATNRPLLPVTVGDVGNEPIPPGISNVQIVSYLDRSADNIVELVRALGGAVLRAAPPTPAVPPPLPAVPHSYLWPFEELIRRDSLSYAEQRQCALGLEPYLINDEIGDQVRSMLRKLRGRPDIAESVARQIDAMLNPATAQQATTGNQPANWYPDPLQRYELRYWDGTKWTAHVARGGVMSENPI
jgi:hypothetical protein